MESGNENHFFRRIALRTIESRRRFGFAEDVGYAVIADAVSRSKVGMGVVVECAPADSSGVLRIGGELIVNTRVADGVFRLALYRVDALGGISVADKLRVEIARVVRLQQRPAKVVHRENILEKFRRLEVANASGLSTGIKLASHRIGLRIEVVIVL